MDLMIDQAMNVQPCDPLLVTMPLEMQICESREQSRANIRQWFLHTQGYEQFPDPYFDMMVDMTLYRLWSNKRKRD